MQVNMRNGVSPKCRSQIVRSVSQVSWCGDSRLEDKINVDSIGQLQAGEGYFEQCPGIVK